METKTKHGLIYISQLGCIPYFVHIFLDGKELNDCIAADDKQGWALCYARDEKGAMHLNKYKDEIACEILTGEVEIRIDNAKHNS